jgi:hypothetical protein
MALRSFGNPGFTPTQQADTTTLTGGTYLALIGGNGTQRCRVEEIYMGGQAGASSVNAMVLCRSTTIGATTGNSGTFDNLLDSSGTALATTVVTYNTATTGPSRLAAAQFLALTFNSFGGIVRWVTSPNAVGAITVGNTRPLGEMTLSAANIGTAGAMSAHIIYEPY